MSRHAKIKSEVAFGVPFLPASFRLPLRTREAFWAFRLRFVRLFRIVALRANAPPPEINARFPSG
jgi:hypothetical protein